MFIKVEFGRYQLPPDAEVDTAIPPQFSRKY